MAEHKDGRGEHFYTRTKPKGVARTERGERGTDSTTHHCRRRGMPGETSLVYGSLTHSLT